MWVLRLLGSPTYDGEEACPPLGGVCGLASQTWAELCEGRSLMADQIHLDPKSPHARRAAEQARALVTARMETEGNVFEQTLDAVLNEVYADPCAMSHLVAALSLLSSASICTSVVEQNPALSGQELRARAYEHLAHVFGLWQERGWTI